LNLMLVTCVLAQETPAGLPQWQRAADGAVNAARERFPDLEGASMIVGSVATTAEQLQFIFNEVPEPSRKPGSPAVLVTIDRNHPRKLFVARLVNADREEFPQAEPGTVNVHGILRNLPGYILNTPNFLDSFIIWAEAGGKVVATETQLMGTTSYLLKGVPSNIGSIVIKAKIRGYDLMTLHPGLAIPAQQPAGTIAGIDIDFHNMQPITRPVRILVQSNGSTDNPSFPSGDRARVFAQETGQAVETVSQNGLGEVNLQDVITGWNINFLALNLDKGYFTGKLGPIIIPEDGGSAYTTIIRLN